ncbi:hypothetical protein KAW65_02235 [candidate division WOR-3 bacterium]|nr:hypothetical protein [candidate division WOR-3 bacterium]
MKKWFSFFFLIILPCLSFSVTTSMWEVRDFKECKLENIMLDKDGFARLSPEIKCVWDNPEVYIWSFLKLGKGLYVGTGAEGKVYKIESPPKADKGKLLFDTKEAGVFSLNLWKGKLYAGTAPHGFIYVIDKKGEGKIFKETGEEYIWDIVFDEKGNLYAATGTEGKILKITKQGVLDTFYITGEMNVSSLLYSKPYLYAGTGESGLLFRINKYGKGFCIYDASEPEITEIILRDTLLFIATTGDTSGSIYKIFPDNKVEKIWQTNSPIQGMQKVPASPSQCGGNKFLVATKNRVYRIDTDGEEELLFELPTNISCISDNWVGTSEVGKVYKMSARLAKDGTLESTPYDTKGISIWGRLDFEGEGNIGFQTRSGNTGKPDKTWEDWKCLGSDDKIKSSPSRFIQWKASLKNANAILKEVKFAHLPQNEKPMILSIEFSKPMPEENIPEGAKEISWTANDPNGDSLSFNLYFKLTTEKEWTLLEESFKDTFYYIDPKSFPDGKYIFKVEASDSPSNPPGSALRSEKLSTVYLIDNTAPEIEIKNVGTGLAPVLSFKVTDNLSYIKSCEYALDGGSWKLIFPADKLFDSKIEEFKIKIGEAKKVVIRVSDACGNMGLKSQLIKLK